MQFEDFDHKTREAARQHHPAFDEAAWEKMQVMLDKHLPEKKNDRRPLIFFLVLFLLIGGGVWMILDKPRQQQSPVTSSEKEVLKNAGGGSSWNTSPSGEVRSNEQKPLIGKDDMVIVQDRVKKIRAHTQPDETHQIISVQPASPVITETGNTVNKNDVEPKAEIPAILRDTEPVINTNQPVNPLTVTGDIASTTQKNKKTIRNGFSFSLTAGLSTSSSEGGSMGRIKPSIGAGITYTIKDKFSIRSGFYSGHKVYVSEPYEYHPPDVFWTYYPNLEQVNADCKIYEIPLSLAYHFGQSSKQNWFASAGVSAYLMKDETYKFLYKNAAGQLNTRTWNFADKNKHFFSTLTLSGGYQRSLGKTLSVSVEPYLKLPLKGVGYGNVKLSSAGVLLSLEFKPFRNR